MKKNSWGIIVSILFAILIFILSIIPSDFNGEPPSFFFKGIDKVVHGLMYGIFSILVVNEYLKRNILKRGRLLIILAAIFTYSVLMELIQLFLIEYRSGDWRDALANMLGIIVGTTIILIIKKIKY